jgi:glycosyltransferase involved in cell wall biosynthesis
MKLEMTNMSRRVGVSVVIPTCDRPNKLRRAVNSVIYQIDSNDELIIANNGYNDVNIEESTGYFSVDYLDPYCGASHARNEGVQLASNEYVAFLDDDDMWEEGYLERVKREIHNHDPDVLVTALKKKGSHKKYKCIDSDSDLLTQLLVGNPGFGGSNIVVKRSIFEEIGGFREEFKVGNDRAFGIDLLLHDATVRPCCDVSVIVDKEGDDRLGKSTGKYDHKRKFFDEYKNIMDWKLWIISKKRINHIAFMENRSVLYIIPAIIYKSMEYIISKYKQY